MNRSALLLITAATLAACSSPEQPKSVPGNEALDSAFADAKTYKLLDLPNLDDNVHNDTLLIYTTHAMGNGLFVMAARNVEDTREGLRLYLYRPRPDSSADVLAYSKPAYDSAVMLPTYFTTGDTADGIIILANYGERESWGQNVFLLKNDQIKDLGWLDVAERDWKTQDDSTFQWRDNIAPQVKVKGEDGRFAFTFEGDSVQLYDDLQAHKDVMLPTDHIAYHYDGTQMVLMVDGEERIADTL